MVIWVMLWLSAVGLSFPDDNEINELPRSRAAKYQNGFLSY
jgi:hypothetical protein